MSVYLSWGGFLFLFFLRVAFIILIFSLATSLLDNFPVTTLIKKYYEYFTRVVSNSGLSNTVLCTMLSFYKLFYKY